MSPLQGSPLTLIVAALLSGIAAPWRGLAKAVRGRRASRAARRTATQRSREQQRRFA
jgi:hypothetical protein